MEIINDGSLGGKYIFKCTECESKLTFEMTFFFETDIDVYCPCTNIMEYIGSK